jgi:hypothetical protein
VLVTLASIIGAREGGRFNTEWWFTNHEPRHNLARSYDSVFALLSYLKIVLFISLPLSHVEIMDFV